MKNALIVTLTIFTTSFAFAGVSEGGFGCQAMESATMSAAEYANAFGVRDLKDLYLKSHVEEVKNFHKNDYEQILAGGPYAVIVLSKDCPNTKTGFGLNISIGDRQTFKANRNQFFGDIRLHVRSGGNMIEVVSGNGQTVAEIEMPNLTLAKATGLASTEREVEYKTLHRGQKIVLKSKLIPDFSEFPTGN